MNLENISSIKTANEAFIQADSQLDAIETGMDGVMEKVYRMEALTDKIRGLSLKAGTLATGALAEKLENSSQYADEALEDLRVVGINPQTEAAGSFFTNFLEAQNAQRRVLLFSQDIARRLSAVPGVAEIEAQGTFIGNQDQLLEEELKSARSSIKSAVRTSSMLRREDSL